MNSPTPSILMPAIGAQLAGGICLGHHFVAGLPYALIVPPKAEREHQPAIWNKSLDRVDGALSYFDGLANTQAMAAAGSKLAAWALERAIAGLKDWYIPARAEALIIHGNLGEAGVAYQDGGAEAFEDDWYWTSTQYASLSDYAWYQDFGWGHLYDGHKSDAYRAFVVRRELIR